MSPVVVANAAVCAALFWTCFCRIVRTDEGTAIPVRLGFVVLASCALACGLAPLGLLEPLLPGERPNWAQVLIVSAMVTVQGLTARYWRNGVPCHFQKEQKHAEQ